MSAAVSPPMLLAAPEVFTWLGVSKATFWRMVIRGDFPKPLTIGRRSKRWPMPEVEAWIAARSAERSKASAAS